MSATIAGLSTLGVTFGYGVETTGNTKPTVFHQLDRIASISGISMDTEKLDASTLEDTATKYIAGRSDTGGTFDVTINYTSETAQEWADLISAYNTGMQSNKNTWFEIIIPSMTNAFFVVAQPPQNVPMPELNSNEVLQVTISLTVVEYKGESAKVAFS